MKRRRPRRKLTPAESYAHDVLEGKIVVGELVRLAVERYFRDLDRQATPEFPYYHDPEIAQHAIDFFTLLRHSKGEWSGAVFELAPWQEFILWNVFGWLDADTGFRRFRQAYISIARKNGKSTFAAGVGTYLFIGEDEPGAEIYTAATKRKQAGIIHEEAKRMIEGSSELAPYVDILRDNISIPGTASKYEPLGKDSKTEDGLNVYGAIIDELHAHPDRGMYDVLRTATGSRRSPLVFIVTTAGFNQETICFEVDDYAQKVLRGTIEDERRFAYIARIDKSDDPDEPGDDPFDEAVWIKANPNLGVSVKIESLREEANEAKNQPRALNTFLRLRMNQWTQSVSRWLRLEDWDACGGTIDVEALEGRECFAGLDLSSTTDLTALVLVFPPTDDDPFYYVLPFFWIPSESMIERAARDGVPYDLWVDRGYIFETEGAVVDQNAIRVHANDLAEIYNIREIPADRWNAAKLITELREQDGFEVVAFGQGFASMSNPAKQTETLVRKHLLRHGGNPVLRWMAENVAIETDAAENIKPSKKKSTERIDGIVALVMGIGRATTALEASIYDKRGIRTLGEDYVDESDLEA